MSAPAEFPTLAESWDEIDRLRTEVERWKFVARRLRETWMGAELPTSPEVEAALEAFDKADAGADPWPPGDPWPPPGFIGPEEPF